MTTDQSDTVVRLLPVDANGVAPLKERFHRKQRIIDLRFLKGEHIDAVPIQPAENVL